MSAKWPIAPLRVGDLEILQLDGSSWRISDPRAVDMPCPIVGVVDRVDDSYRVTLLDRPTETERHATLAGALAAVEASLRF